MDIEREKLVLDNMDLVYKITGKYNKKLRNLISREEIESALNLALVESALRFDFSLNIDFRKYVNMRLHGSVVDYIRSVKNWGASNRRKTDIKFSSSDDENFDVEEKNNNQKLFETESFFEGIKKCLTEFEYQVVREMIFNDLTAIELSEMKGKKYYTIRNAFKVAKEKIKIFFSTLEYDEKNQWHPLFWMYDIKEETKPQHPWQKKLRKEILPNSDETN